MIDEQTLSRAVREIGGTLYLVGGAVRDELRRKPVKDRDYVVCGVPMETLLGVLRKHGSVDVVGKSFGVVKFGRGGETVDIALPRTERSTGDGHRDFEVNADPKLPIAEDLRRRDFTINAIAREVGTGKLVDPFGGSADLRARVLRMVSKQGFREDPLRILRGVQFAARFHLMVDGRTMLQMRRDAQRVEHLSAERIAVELDKLLTLSDRPSKGMRILRDAGVLRFMFPELENLVGIEQPKKHHIADAFEHTLLVLDATRPDINLRLGALMHDIGKADTFALDPKTQRITFHGHQMLGRRMAEKRLNAWKMYCVPGVDMERILMFCEMHMFDMYALESDASVRRLIRKVGGPEAFYDLVEFRIADKLGGSSPHTIYELLQFQRRAIALLHEAPAFSVKDLAIGGEDVIALGVPKGPEIGRLLRALFDRVEEDPSLNTADRLTELARAWWRDRVQAASEPGAEPGGERTGGDR